MQEKSLWRCQEDRKERNWRLEKNLWRITSNFGRIAAQSAKQVISSRVRGEKNRQYEDFIDKQGLILSGIIKD